MVALFVTVAAFSASLAAASSALASGAQVLADCNATSRLSRTYSTADLRAALRTMPADIKEYTDCYDVIKRAELAQISGVQSGERTASESSGGSFLPAPLIVALVLLVLAAGGFGIMAIRRRVAK